MKIQFSATLLLSLFALSLLVFHVPSVLSWPVDPDPWDDIAPALPPSEDTVLEFWIAENGTAFVTVTITFYDTKWGVDEWGNLTRDGSDFFGDSYVWVYVGDEYTAPAVWDEVHDFNLGQADEGVYSFTFMAWGEPVKSLIFEIGFPADINDDGKVDIKDVRIVGRAFGLHSDDPNWNPDADIYEDGTIDMRDIRFTAKHFGETAP